MSTAFNIPAGFTRVTADDFVEHSHPHFGRGYFCTPDVIDKINAAAPPVDAVPGEQVASEKMVLVPRDLLQAASKSLGSFVSEEGWAQQDMDVMDGIDALLAARTSTGEAQS